MSPKISGIYFCNIAACGLAWFAFGFRAFKRLICRYCSPTEPTTNNRKGAPPMNELRWERSFWAKSIPKAFNWPWATTMSWYILVLLPM